MNKSDYDKYYKKGGTYVIPIEIFNELFDELERQISNYEQALEDLDKKENIIKKAKDFINGKNLKENEYRFAEDFDFAKLLEILDKVDKENI